MNKSERRIPFHPAIGPENLILKQDPREGWVWFATDSKKIYYSNGETHLPMGGNSSVFYGTKSFDDEVVDEGQVEFEFSVYEIDGNDEVTNGNFKVPNIDDLILNEDGCFYRVTDVDGEAEDTVIYTLKLTIAGTGGGGNGDGPATDTNVGKLEYDRVTAGNVTCLYGRPFAIKFNVKATDASGEQTGSGTYSVEINGVKDVIKGTCVQGENTVEVGHKLELKADGNKVRIYVSMDTGGSSFATQSKLWTVVTTQIELDWEYEQSQLNDITRDFNIRYSVSGYQIPKTVTITVDDIYEFTPSVFTSTAEQVFKLDPAAIGGHGAHKVELKAVADVNGVVINDIPTVTKNVIFVDYSSSVPIISCNFFDKKVKQYNTVQIPIVFYAKDNSASTMSATLKENDNEVDTWDNIENGKVYYWNYTPTVSYPPRKLTTIFGTASKTLTLDVEAVNIDNAEIGGYAFRFKASDFPSNSAVQAWGSTNNMATFSENFDWINGGIKSELDEKGNTRQYFCIKAGSTMTINYKLFEQNPTAAGKAFKFIFKAANCRDYDAQVLKCYDGTKGILMRAQNALFSGTANSLDVPYCEDSYIEFEFDITKAPSDPKDPKRYMFAWLDGVPTVFKQYSSSESFLQSEVITIGSNDCDVYIYMIKAYENHLDDESHLSNFIADAPNAQEMLDRYDRNDIIDKELNTISPTLLAKKNPNCRVHIYEIDRMTLTKKDKIKNCNYKQYHGSDTPVLTADGVTIKVQGTSSAAYGLAAFNLDSEFENGFKDASGTHMDGWSMNPNSIPVNYFCTKVNVASAEQANNALNQEWYNRYQPYKTRLRRKNPNARDTMEFVPGVLFIQDHNTKKDMTVSDNFIKNNVFAEIPGYVGTTKETTGLYPRMYSICNMGNSKKNVTVLHDTTNPIEYCVEVADNQKPMQWMTHCDYDDSLWAADEPDWEFRYPDGYKEISEKEEDGTYASPLTGTMVSNRQHAFDSWRRFITWMAHSNPQPAYKEEAVKSDTDLQMLRLRVSEAIAILDGKILEQNNIIQALDFDIATLLNGRTEEELNDSEKEELDALKGKKEDAEAEILALEDEKKITPSEIYAAVKTADGVLTALPELVQASASYDATKTYYTPTANKYGYTLAPLEESKTFGPHTFAETEFTEYLGGVTVSTYKGTYTHDTYEYRMAKMLDECEDYLVMDSVMFHYLFIERHTMIDNVSKNTFWSTEDGLHWNLTKDYDNDTSDGNDNQGKLTLTYGIEPLDNVPGSVDDFYFNANQSVWFRFCGGLYTAARALYNALESTGDSGEENAWDAAPYLEAFTEWQKTIPERCWIEDYYRKYVRPLEIYGDSMFVDMLEGGLKTHQRKQYETYQNYYMASKYFGKAASGNRIIVRGNGNEYGKGLPVSMYADCYIQAAFGSGQEPNVTMRVKRNQDVTIRVPSTLGTMDNATIYFFLPQMYQTIGELDKGSLNMLLPEQITVSPAVKLRTLIAGQYGEKRQTNPSELLENQSLEDIGFENNIMLEELHMCNYFPNSGQLSAEGQQQSTLGDLDLTAAVNLKTLDVRNSGFTSIKIAAGAPITSMQLCQPATVDLADLKHLETLTFERPEMLKTVIVDNIDDSVINSKTHLIDVASTLDTYRLRNVNWTISNISDINTSTKKINILEKLLAITPFTEQSSMTQAKHADSLTGKLTITAALDSAVAKDIYEYYSLAENVDNVKYPNLEINFTNANLRTVTILNGNGKPMWTRKFANGYAQITADDLKVSPYGAFETSKVIKPSSELYDYVFANKWNIYNGNMELISQNVPTPDGHLIPELKNITTDMILEPIFDSNQRSWLVHLDYCDPTNPEGGSYGGLATAGETLTSWLIRNGQTVAHRDDSSLPLTETYSFKGWSLSKSSNAPINTDDYIITNEATFYALYEEKNVYDNVHEDYFEYELRPYTDAADDSYSVVEGYMARPKSHLFLRGKVTIPATYAGLPVWGIQAWNADPELGAKTYITHVFVGRTNKNDPTSTNLKFVDTNTFNNCVNLKYFDFPQTTLRVIGSWAFRLTSSLEPNYNNGAGYYFGDNVIEIGTEAFNAGLKFTGTADIIISEKIRKIGSQAFAYLEAGNNPGAQINIYIGSANKAAEVDFATGVSSDEAYRIFTYNSPFVGAVQFYTSKYNSWDDTVKEGMPALKYWFDFDNRIGNGNWELHGPNGKETI